MDPFAVPAVLGWSNSDCGLVSHRLYALDRDQRPRWAQPHARVVEQVLEEHHVNEGARAVVVVIDDRFLTPELLQLCVEAAQQAVVDQLSR